MLARTERIRLAGHVGCDPRTVIAWLKDPQSVRRYLADKLADAAKKLKIDLEQDDDTGSEG
jgi:hypothetical protein